MESGKGGRLNAVALKFISNMLIFKADSTTNVFAFGGFERAVCVHDPRTFQQLNTVNSALKYEVCICK